MVDTILVPMDGSSKSKEALEHALTVHAGADVTVLHVMTPFEELDAQSSLPTEENIREWYELSRERSENVFGDARELAAKYDTEIETVLEVGEPWRAIVSYAGDHAIDLIVMGSHGRTDDSSLWLGSVAETVMRRSPVIVSIVR